MPRPTTVRRVEFYLGPDKEVAPDDLDSYEKQGGWVIEPKIDGMWCMLEVRDPANGEHHLLKSRDARTGEVGSSVAGEIRSMPIDLPMGTVLVGELEAASQWATEVVEQQGFRRLHVFDIPRFGYGQDFRELPWFVRKEKLHQVMQKASCDHVVASRLQIVHAFDEGFREKYDRFVKDGLEGLVLKKRLSTYSTNRSDGKTNDWLRCKRWVTDEFVLTGLAETDGGEYGNPRVTGQWGLFVNGKLKKAMQTSAPKELLVEENIGKLVAEFMGWRRFRSGALQHAQFVRIREDKQPEECVLKCS